MTVEYDLLPKNDANFVALSPISFLHRCADIYPHRESIIYNQRRYSWSETRERCTRMAASLLMRGIGKNDTVSVFAFNTPELVECHFSIPMAGAVLNTINTRLDAATVAYIIDHGESCLIMVDRELWPVLAQALTITKRSPEIIIIDDADALEKPDLPDDITFSFYEDLVNQNAPVQNNTNKSQTGPEDEWQALALNYTSGTTGLPKGVVYHHRGSYLMTMGTVVSWALPPHPCYLYTVPMFHCNGWGHAWTMAAVAGTIICLRAFSPKLLFDLVEQHNVTHFGGAPIVLNMLANAPKSEQKLFKRKIKVMTAGAPPPAKVLESMDQFGFDVVHVYGLTESYGHILHSAEQADWAEKSIEQQAELKSRQGVRFAMTEAVDVIDPDTGDPVPHDAKTIGEIVIRSNTIMKGYLKDPATNLSVFKGNWFISGDLAVIHADGYIQVKDRAKDIIISGGENISSVEIENILYKHAAVGEAAVVAMDDEKWGEVPCAFVELKPQQTASESEIIDFCASNMARFKKPKKVIFGELPKTATGKIQKNVLRERVKTFSSENN